MWKRIELIVRIKIHEIIEAILRTSAGVLTVAHDVRGLCAKQERKAQCKLRTVAITQPSPTSQVEDLPSPPYKHFHNFGLENSRPNAD